MSCINTILVFIFVINLTFPNLHHEILLVDSLYESGEYNQTSAILIKLYDKHENNIEIVYRLARSIFVIAEEEPDINRQADIYYKGFEYAKKSLNIDSKNGYANFWYAAYIGKIGLLEGTEQKIINSYKVREFGMKAIELVPDYEHSYHLMGRWHYELAELTWFERSIASLVYSSPPTGSYEKAAKLFKKAIEINFLEIRHHFWLAKTYKAQGKNRLAKKEFDIVINLKPRDKKDKDMQFESKKNF